jgi:hypothetical protein
MRDCLSRRVPPDGSTPDATTRRERRGPGYNPPACRKKLHAFSAARAGGYAYAMLLRGSCQCGKVTCYCSICRKTTGALTSNVMGEKMGLTGTGRRRARPTGAR